MDLVLMAAVAEGNVIGFKGGLPWRDWKELTKKDLGRFKDLTLGKSVIMGRKTFESIPEKFRPLPGRKNIVLSRDESYSPGSEEVDVYRSFPECLDAIASIEGDVYVIGGSSVYQEALPLAQRLELTEIHKSYNGDTFFPEFDRKMLVEEHREENEGFDFVRYARLAYE